MIAGIVNADFEAIISLSICDSDGKIHTHEANITWENSDRNLVR